MQKKCRNCGSDDWKLASLVHNSGSATVDISTTGESRGRGLGGEHSTTTSQSTGSFQTKLAQLAAPPARLPPPGEFKTLADYQKITKWTYWGATVFMAYLGISGAKNAFVGLFWAAVLLVFNKPILGFLSSEDRYARQKDEHAENVARYEDSLKAYQRWEHTRICLRCGTFDGESTNVGNM